MPPKDFPSGAGVLRSGLKSGFESSFERYCFAYSKFFHHVREKLGRDALVEEPQRLVTHEVPVEEPSPCFRHDSGQVLRVSLEMGAFLQAVPEQAGGAAVFLTL